MMNRPLLATPTPWLAAGMGLVVALVCLLTGLGDGFASSLHDGYQGLGFPLRGELNDASPGMLGMLVVVTLGVVVALEGTPGGGRRIMILASGLLLALMASPVLALWGVFWSPFVLMIAMSWSGLAAMIHASSREQRKVVKATKPNRLAEQPRLSPPNRKLK